MSVTHLKLFPRQTDLPFAQRRQANKTSLQQPPKNTKVTMDTQIISKPRLHTAALVSAFFPPFHHPPAALIPLRSPVSPIGPPARNGRSPGTDRLDHGFARASRHAPAPRRAAPLGISRSRRITRRGILRPHLSYEPTPAQASNPSHPPAVIVLRVGVQTMPLLHVPAAVDRDPQARWAAPRADILGPPSRPILMSSAKRC